MRTGFRIISKECNESRYYRLRALLGEGASAFPLFVMKGGPFDAFLLRLFFGDGFLTESIVARAAPYKQDPVQNPKIKKGNKPCDDPPSRRVEIMETFDRQSDSSPDIKQSQDKSQDARHCSVHR